MLHSIGLLRGPLKRFASPSNRKPAAVGISVDPNNGVVYIADATLSAVPHSLYHGLLRVDCNNIGEYLEVECTYPLRRRPTTTEPTLTHCDANSQFTPAYRCTGLNDVDVPNVQKGACANTLLGQSCKVRSTLGEAIGLGSSYDIYARHMHLHFAN